MEMSKLKKNRKAIAVVEAVLSVLIWGASFPATKLALREALPVTVVWIRFAMGVIVLGIAVMLRKEWRLPNLRDLGYFAGLGLLGITFHQWLQSTGMETSQATTAAWIVATSPVFIALLGWLALKEKMNGWKAGGVILAGFGMTLVVSKGNLGALINGHFGVIGDLLIFISAVNWAVFSVLSRYGLKRYPAARMMFLVMIFGWLFTTIQFFTGPGLKDISHISGQGWLGLSFLGIFCSGLAYIFWYDALFALPASEVGVFLYIEPLATMVVAAIVLGEPLLLVSMLGGAIILLGVWLVNRPAPAEDDAKVTGQV